MKKRKHRPVASSVPPAPAGKRGVSLTDLSRAKAVKQPPNVFVPAEHPGSVRVAMDSAVSDIASWAAASGSAYSDGEGFIGYAALALLAQRPEYRRICEIIAFEMTRKWVSIRATGEKDKTERIAEIEKELRRLNVRDAFRRAALHDGQFGRAHIYMDFGSTDDPEELKTPIGTGTDGASRAKIELGSFSRLKVVEAIWCYPVDYNSTDPLRADWYSPRAWLVNGKEVHGSRLLTFVGREVPDLLKPAYSFGGVALTQMARPYVQNWLRTQQSVSDLLHSFSVSGVKVDLVNALQTENQAEGLYNRVDLFTALRDNRGTMVLDKEEEFFNVSTPLGTLDALQAQSQEHMAAVSGIPIVKLLGIQPAGLNASSEGEIRSFYDWIHDYQEMLFRPRLKRLIDFVQLSRFGDVDPEIDFVFESLWALDEVQQAEVRKVEAETGEVLIRSGAISKEEERARIAADPDAPYASIDVSAVPPAVETSAERATAFASVTAAVVQAVEGNLVSTETGLRQLQPYWPAITSEDIAEAENAPPEPGEGALPEPPVPVTTEREAA